MENGNIITKCKKFRESYNIYLDSEILKELKIQAVKEGTDVSKILEKLSIEYLKKKDNSSPTFVLANASKET